MPRVKLRSQRLMGMTKVKLVRILLDLVHLHALSRRAVAPPSLCQGLSGRSPPSLYAAEILS
jgi:hypothetical protein